MVLKVSIHIICQHLSYLMERVVATFRDRMVEVRAGMGSFAGRKECGSM